jgi:uncharacterized Tic20 family protein
MTEPEEHPPRPEPEPERGPDEPTEPTPRMSEAQARTWAAMCHLGGLAWIVVPIANIIVPLTIWLLKREQHPLIDRNGKESLNFQISMTIYAAISVVLMAIVIGFILLAAVAIADLVLTIIASIKTSNGDPYRYPLTIRLVK